MDRRRFLIGGTVAAVAAGGVLALPKLGPVWQRLTAPETRLGAGAMQVIGSLRGTDTLAQAFLDLPAPDGGWNLAVIEDALITRLQLADALDIDSAAFSARLRTAIAEDFRAGHLCAATEWVLSDTECRVAALRWLRFGSAATGAQTQLRDGVIVAVEEWGPQGTRKNVAVNVQPDGHSGLWFKAVGAPSWLKLQIGEDIVSTVVSEHTITSGLYGSLQDKILGAPGEYPVALIDEMSGIRQPLGVFVVTPTPAFTQLADGRTSTAFCAISEWGPQEMRVGENPNPQPEGAMGLWLKITCAPDKAKLVFDGAELQTSVQHGLITALLPASYLAVAREADLVLHDPHSNETLAVGTLSIKD